MITTVTPVPNLLNPLIILAGANHRPSTIKPAIIITGIRLIKMVIILILYCVMFITRPPTIHPTGMVIIPARIPAPRYGLSSFLIMDNATGMVNTRVGPIMVPRINPEKLPKASVSASSIANGYPPISQARSVVANIDASAPSSS